MRLVPGANTIILTLNDAITLADPEYVLVIQEQHNKKKVACKLGSDTSDYPARYNRFTLTVQASVDPLLAQVTLKDKTHRYYVYEKADADAFDFAGVDDMDLEDITGLVEEGIVQYITPETAPAHYKDLPESVESYGD